MMKSDQDYESQSVEDKQIRYLSENTYQKRKESLLKEQYYLIRKRKG